MKTYTYHKEIRIIIDQVLNTLNNVVIKRLNEQDDVTNTDSIQVQLKYSPKQRILHDIVNLNDHIQVPVMALSMSNIQYDDKRAFNKIEGFSVSTALLSSGGNFPQPIPITVSLNLSILARYQRDLDQILTCIFSNFFPYIVISYKHPDLGHEVRCVVEWDKAISLEYPLEIQATQPYRLIANSSFKVFAWMYRNANLHNGIIHNIDSTYTAVSNIYDNYDTMKDMMSSTRTDYIWISGRPQIKGISPYIVTTNEADQNVNVIGDMFFNLSGLYVSAAPNIYPLSSYHFYNPFADSPRLSSVYTGFSAVSVEEWTITSNNRLNFTLPTPLSAGYVDIIGWNIAGMGTLKEDSVRTIYNPYVSGTEEYNDFKGFQWPYISGLEVRTV